MLLSKMHWQLDVACSEIGIQALSEPLAFIGVHTAIQLEGKALTLVRMHETPDCIAW